MLTKLDCAALMLLQVVILSPMRTLGAESPPKLIEFGGISVPARPVPLPEWEAPTPSGVAVDSSALPPTPVPAPAVDAAAASAQSARSNDSTIGAAAERKKMRFVVRGNRSLPADHIKAVLTPYIYGDNLDSASAALQHAYLTAGHPLARVNAAPPTDNVVLFNVVEPKLRSMQVLPGSQRLSGAAASHEPDAGVPPDLRMTRGLRVIRTRSTH